MWRSSDVLTWRTVCVLLVGFVSVAFAQQQADDRVIVPISDPSKPALIDVSLVSGSITVRGASRKDVAVTARPDAE